MKPVYLKSAILTLLFYFSLASAFAQYIWLDEKGVKQYSDRAPASSIPKNRILKQPGGDAQIPAATPSSDTPDSASNGSATNNTAAKDAKPLTTAERNAEFNKRQMEQAANDKKAADEAKTKADRSKNCDRANTYKRSLDSGERIVRADKSGEREYLSDSQRAQEARETQRILNDCK